MIRKVFLIILILLCFTFCTKKVGVRASISPQDNNVATTKPCDGTPVTYNGTIKNILHNNCSPCHDVPGSGGINLDSYEPSAALAKSGQLIPVVLYTPGDISMPPPPQKQLDSCEIKALTLWIKEGCPQN